MEQIQRSLFRSDQQQEPEGCAETACCVKESGNRRDGGYYLIMPEDYSQKFAAIKGLNLLLEYKNANFSGFDPMEEFTLEW